MTKKAIVPGLALLAALISSAAFGQYANQETVSGVLLASPTCPQAPFVLASCPCPIPQVLYHVYSTKIDLSQYAGRFVTLRGSVQAGNCQAALFQAKKATIEPDRPCPCTADSLAP